MSRVWGMGGELGVSASRPSSDLSKSPCPRKLAGRSAWPVHSCRCEEAPLTRAAQRRSVRQRPRKEAEAAVYIALSCKRSKYGIADAIGGATERPMISDLRCEESDHR